MVKSKIFNPRALSVALRHVYKRVTAHSNQNEIHICKTCGVSFRYSVNLKNHEREYLHGI